jgi:RNA polymerase sigma factor (sigma-70 family)
VRFMEQDLEDLHNTVFLNLFERKCRKLRQYRGKNGCSLATWIRVVALRILLNHLRKKGPDAAFWQKKRISIDELDHVRAEETDTPALMERAEQESLVQQGLQSLTPRDRLFVKLHFHQGLSVEEVARTMRISIENAYTVKHRAIQRLRAYVTTHGG